MLTCSSTQRGLDPSPPSPAAKAWLTAPGSLTARLRAHGAVHVLVQQQGSQRFWPDEQRDLHKLSGHVREVVLHLDGIPVVWARSATSHQAIKGAWKALSGLGTRPLAELLFQGKHVKRDVLRIHHLRHHRQHHARMNLSTPSCQTPSHPIWARSSVFWHQGQALRVMEAFSPYLLSLDAHRLNHPPR